MQKKMDLKKPINDFLLFKVATTYLSETLLKGVR